MFTPERFVDTLKHFGKATATAVDNYQQPQQPQQHQQHRSHHHPHQQQQIPAGAAHLSKPINEVNSIRTSSLAHNQHHPHHHPQQSHSHSHDPRFQSSHPPQNGHDHLRTASPAPSHGSDLSHKGAKEKKRIKVRPLPSPFPAFAHHLWLTYSHTVQNPFSFKKS